MSFSFGFAGDDIEEDPNDVQQTPHDAADAGQDVPPPIPAQTHDLNELLASLPDKISYSIFTTTSPKGFTACLPRRELFDVRLQIMAEDDGTAANPLAGLDDTDLQTNIYEGGYKTWECSIDLVRYLLDHGPRKDLDDLARVNHVLEMGCGSALPSLLLFQHALRNSLPIYFSLTDYNADVLRLVTLPNMLLAWAATLDAQQSAEVFGEAGNPLLVADKAGEAGSSSSGSISKAAEADTEDELNGDLYLTPSILSHFTTHLSRAGITLTFLSGSWLPVSTLLPLIPSTPDLNTLVLASETIYSPASQRAFSEALVALLSRVRLGKALVAAKRVYFGVGGSVDGFMVECAERGAVAGEVELEGLESGVRRAIVEVQMVA